MSRQIAKGWGSNGGGARNAVRLQDLNADAQRTLQVYRVRDENTSKPAIITSDTHAMDEDWIAYQTYFDGSL
jgi:hypothetical protein